MKKILLSIFLTFTITLFIYSQEVTVSGGHSLEKNKTTKVVLNAINGSVEIHKHVLEGMGYGYGSGSAWDDDLGYISTRTTTTVNSSTTEYLCNTPAELTVDKPVKLSIGGNEDLSFTINPTGGTQYWDIKAFEDTKFWWGFTCYMLSFIPMFYCFWEVLEYSYDEPSNLPLGIASGIGGVTLFTTGIILSSKSSHKITLLKIEY